jgi:uncharacterized protein (DUF488 family)
LDANEEIKMGQNDKIYLDFDKEVKETIILYKKTVGGFTPRTYSILNNHDKIKSIGNLMKSGEAQKGFKTLRKNNRLDKAFEFLVIKYKQLFNSNIAEAAQWRLDHAYDME